MNRVAYYYNYLESLFYGYPLVIRIAIFLTFLLALIYIISLARIFFMAFRRKRAKIRQEKIRKRYEDKLTILLFSEKDLSSAEIQSDLKINPSALKSWEKEYISELVLNLINQTNEVELE